MTKLSNERSLFSSAWSSETNCDCPPPLMVATKVAQARTVQKCLCAFTRSSSIGGSCSVKSPSTQNTPVQGKIAYPLNGRTWIWITSCAAHTNLKPYSKVIDKERWPLLITGSFDAVVGGYRSTFGHPLRVQNLFAEWMSHLGSDEKR
jgi:hypothetical protein